QLLDPMIHAKSSNSAPSFFCHVLYFSTIARATVRSKLLASFYSVDILGELRINNLVALPLCLIHMRS
ncbi:MAG: hypothetical protein WB612_11700, partial [Nitrososphaeraceae archaeon]